MRYLLDTNLLSETMRAHPDAGVTSWMAEQSAQELALSALTFGEIRSGIVRMRDGLRKTELIRWLFDTLPERFAGRVLPVDDTVALEWGRLTAEAEMRGRKMQTVDALLVATARVRDLIIVTRNERHCSGWGPALINPWSDKASD
jgi:predicted nucleic acid-binding protein